MINKAPVKVFKTDKILAILSKEKFIKRAKDFWGDNVVCISIRNPETEALDLDFFYGFKSYLTVDFYDTEEGDPYPWISDEKAEIIRNFILEHKECKFILHCDAGQSRSAGVGKAVECLTLFDGNVYNYRTSNSDINEDFGFFPNRTVFDKIVAKPKA